jgi:hypothetical protein
MPLYTDVTLELRNKLRRELDIIDRTSKHGNYLATITFKEDESHLMEECKTWLNVIHKFFRTTYNAYRLTKIGRFEGVRPQDVNDVIAVFSVKSYSEKSWRDWFDTLGEGDGFLRGTCGNVINKRTHSEYYKDGKYIKEEMYNAPK